MKRKGGMKGRGESSAVGGSPAVGNWRTRKGDAVTKKITPQSSIPNPHSPFPTWFAIIDKPNGGICQFVG
ncbi:hypothetical protein A6770_24960 [Nostoc minutum NIES-26]|uniref:Uncharacterized protein n=1 Tax=Nostoc minutum NIES-26 TaxID=1844469 RepID=A0A367QWU0_9NOSO|nr:hypothetical protein A6770_24960 [Nostoc minutum NIES-26]